MRSLNPSPFTSPAEATAAPKWAPAWFGSACQVGAVLSGGGAQVDGSARWSSVTPSQSLSRPSQTSADGGPGGGALHVTPPSAGPTVTPDVAHTPRPLEHCVPAP